MSKFQAMRDVAAERGRPLDDDARICDRSQNQRAHAAVTMNGATKRRTTTPIRMIHHPASSRRSRTLTRHPARSLRGGSMDGAAIDVGGYERRVPAEAPRSPVGPPDPSLYIL
jgi:hypothetical protein